jgi:hypothetical protein
MWLYVLGIFLIAGGLFVLTNVLNSHIRRIADALAIPKRKVIEFKKQSLWAKSHFIKTLGSGKMSCIVLLAKGLPCGRVCNSKTASTNPGVPHEGGSRFNLCSFEL